LASEAACNKYGLTPLARVTGYGVAGIHALKNIYNFRISLNRNYVSISFHLKSVNLLAKLYSLLGYAMHKCLFAVYSIGVLALS